MGNRIERFYYDGIRRIQEWVIDPAYSMGEALSSGSIAMQSIAWGPQRMMILFAKSLLLRSTC